MFSGLSAVHASLFCDAGTDAIRARLGTGVVNQTISVLFFVCSHRGDIRKKYKK